jgi:hypothetical protein
VGQRTFETRSLYLILAEKLFTLPEANEMLPLSALFAGKYRVWLLVSDLTLMFCIRTFIVRAS